MKQYTKIYWSQPSNSEIEAEKQKYIDVLIKKEKVIHHEKITTRVTKKDGSGTPQWLLEITYNG